MPADPDSQVKRLVKELIAATAGRADAIDEQIEVLQAPAEKLEYDNPFSSRAIDEAHALRKRITGLEQRRRAILDGNPDPADEVKAPPAAVPSARVSRTLEKPHRTTIRRVKSVVDEGDQPKSDAQQQRNLEFAELLAKTDFNDDVSATEDLFDDYSAEVPAGNFQVAFTRGAYGAFMALHAQTRKEMLVLFEFASNRRKELEKKVDLQQGSKIAAIEILSHRISELEARPTVKYYGVWRENKTYVAGSMATDRGSVWHTDRATTQRPGTGDDWTLACKRGADGKNAKGVG